MVKSMRGGFDYTYREEQSETAVVKSMRKGFDFTKSESG